MTEFLQTIPTMATTEQIQRILNQFVGTNVGAFKEKKNCIVAFCERSPRTRLLLIRRAEDPKWLIASLLSPLLKYTHATPPPQQLNLLRISWWFSRAKTLPSIFTTVVYTVVFFYFFQENYKKNNKALLSRCQLRYPNINRCMCSRRAPAVLQACTTVS